MKLFGYTISKAINSGNKFVQNALFNWNFGRVYADTKNTSSLLKAYESWVYICASRNAAAFSSIPMRLYVALPENSDTAKGITRKIPLTDKKEIVQRGHISSLPAVLKSVDVEEVVDHRWLTTLNTVNPFMNKTDLFEISDLYQELTGNAYWYLLKDGLGLVKEIWPIPPDRMQIIPDRDNFISGYLYSYGNNKKVFKTDEVVHFKWPNPNDLYYGASPLQAVAESFNTNKNMNTYENAMFTNNARPEGFFSSPHDVDDDSFDRIKGELQATYMGVANSGKVGFLDNDTKFLPVSMSPREMSFLKGREWTRKEIYEAYNVPMGLFDDKANRANAEAAQYVYAKYGIRPRHVRFEEKINEQIMPLFDEKLFVAFDNVVPEDKEFELKEDVALQTSGARSINEVRVSRGDEPIDGGNDPLVPRGVVPLSSLLMTPGEDLFGTDEEEIEDEELIEEIVSGVFNKVIETIN